MGGLGDSYWGHAVLIPTAASSVKVSGPCCALLCLWGCRGQFSNLLLADATDAIVFKQPPRPPIIAGKPGDGGNNWTQVSLELYIGARHLHRTSPGHGWPIKPQTRLLLNQVAEDAVNR